MDAPRAMAAFLSTWRRERAALTRAQLADAVTALLPRDTTVTPHVVREWEKGQPPKSTEEFAALCALMRRSGVLPAEVRQFRLHVLAAVCEKQYPGVLARREFQTALSGRTRG